MRSSKMSVPEQCQNALAFIDAFVTPGAKRNRIDRSAKGTLQIRVSESPREGRANRAVAALLAKHLGIPKSRVNVTRGHKSRHKVISIQGLTGDDVQTILTATAVE